jgi:hypothetical protein
MRTFERSRSSWDRSNRRPRLSQTMIKEYFGIHGPHNLQTSIVPGPAQLQRVCVKDMIDWDFLRASTMQTLDMAIDLSHAEVPDMKALQPTIIPSVITRVTLRVSADILGNGGEVWSRSRYLYVLFNGLLALQHLNIKLVQPFSSQCLTPSDDFDFLHLLSTIAGVSASLKDLTIDWRGQLSELDISKIAALQDQSSKSLRNSTSYAFQRRHC